jgi:hypothetical protein
MNGLKVVNTITIAKQVMKSEYLLVEGNYIVINVMQKLVASIKVIRYTLD